MAETLALFSFGPTGWGDELAIGAWLTIRLAIATLPFGLALGFLIALAKRSHNRALRGLGNLFTTVFRGLPELLTIFLVYFGLQLLVQKAASLVSDAPVALPGFISGFIALGLVFAAYSSEVFLTAFNNLKRGQIEAATALALPRFPTVFIVLLPQFVRIALPGIANLWLVLLKDTSLISVIAVDDLMRATYIAVGATKQPFPFYLVACLTYLGMSIVSSFGIYAIERWSERGVRRAA
ncbi:MAG: ABC transporter permease subunit [Bauldia sp.]